LASRSLLRQRDDPPAVARPRELERGLGVARAAGDDGGAVALDLLLEVAGGRGLGAQRDRAGAPPLVRDERVEARLPGGLLQGLVARRALRPRVERVDVEERLEGGAVAVGRRAEGAQDYGRGRLAFARRRRSGEVVRTVAPLAPDEREPRRRSGLQE